MHQVILALRKPGDQPAQDRLEEPFVCSAEKLSVDIVKITPDHTIAGHHAQNQPSARGAGVFAQTSEKLGAGRGLRQGCWSTITVQLFRFFPARF